LLQDRARQHRRPVLRPRPTITLFAFVAAMIGARPHHCRTHHLLTVAPTHRLRDGLGKRYWIECRCCDLRRGPYTEWQAAWLDAWQAPGSRAGT
jgi:hypothetical protein